MQRSKWPLALGGALLLYALYTSQINQPVAAPSSQPAPKIAPKPPAKPKKPDKPCPNCPMTVEATGQAAQHKPELGGLVSPDGSTHVVLSLPDEIDWPKNIASRGLGCCGFRSLDYCARMQGVDALVDWPEQIRSAGTAGGAYPEKVDRLLHQFAPDAAYWQDTSHSHTLLEACMRSQRACAVDYNGHDPHYSGRIAHCVTLVAFSEENDWVAILDNNFPSIDQIVWMSISEFDQRWGGWAYGLLQVTPGKVYTQFAHESWEFFPGKDGIVNYGLDIRQGPFGSYCRLNGEDASTDDIISAIGPAMAPIKVDVDHRMEPIKLDFSALQLALAGGAVLAVYAMTRKE
jgi:hypothetical protein